MGTEKKIELNQIGLEKILLQSYENFQEERDLALERYRRQDESIHTNEDFFIQGKIAVEYLKVASDRSNALFGIGKLIKEYMSKDDAKPGVSMGLTDDLKSEIEKLMKGE